uniref:Uncharacterized protein n=1 Tax=Acrobeloides nanus TaxID=290746 RepID=A0A914C4N1_9BILA
MIVRFNEKITKIEDGTSNIDSSSKSPLYLKIIEEDTKQYVIQVYSDQRPDLLYELRLHESGDKYQRMKQKFPSIQEISLDQCIAMAIEHLSDSLKNSNRDKATKCDISKQEVCSISLVACNNEHQARSTLEKEAKEFELLKSRNQELEHLIQDLEEKCDQLQEELQENESRENKNLNIIEQLRALSERVNEEKLYLSQENEGLRIEVEELQDENRILQDRLNEVEQALKDKNSEFAKVAKKCDDSKRYALDIHKEYKVLKEDSAKAKADLIKSEKVCHLLQEEMDLLVEEKKGLEIKCNQLEEDNKVVRHAHDKLKERLEEKEKAIADLYNRCTCHFSRSTLPANGIPPSSSVQKQLNVPVMPNNNPMSMANSNMPYMHRPYLPPYQGFAPVMNREHMSLVDKENNGPRMPRSKSPFAVNAPNKS